MDGRSLSGLDGVSFVVPVRNGARSVRRVLDAILGEGADRPVEILAVDDGSTDASAAILADYAARGVTVLAGPGRGAAAAINHGVRRARYPIVCQVDQDVVIEPGWARRLVAALEPADVGAAQGYYVSPPATTIWARVMGLDLRERYRRIRQPDPDHVCTGNSAYRAEALRHVGLFDETLGYGYDNDMSYRLTAAGYRLIFCRDAIGVHAWRETARGYLVQQYGVGYGRLDVVAKHRGRFAGDDVSGPGMILHAVGMLAVVVALLAAAGAAVAGGSSRVGLVVAAAVLLALMAERVVVGARAAWHFGDPAGFLFAPVHVLRDVAWVSAIVMWTLRTVGCRRRRPQDSM